MVKTKKYKFSILVDEFGKDKKTLKKLTRLLGEEYPFLKQASRYITTKRINGAKKDDVIVFGSSRKYDVKVVSYEEWEDIVDGRRFKLVELKKQWSKVKRYLDQYAQANHLNEYNDYEDHYCYTYDLNPDWDFNDLYIVQSSPKKKNKVVRTTSKKKTRNSLQLEEVKVHHNFVRVGWDIYDIMLNRQGEEYVKINKKTYWVDRDSAGNGKLSVQ